MSNTQDLMKYETVLPEDFDGVFRFTNASSEDFIGVWGGKEYHFPANTTSPIIIPDQSPLDIQNIRKKFAKDYAVREYFKSQKYKTARKQEGTPGNRTMNSIHQAATYTLDDLAPFIQECLKPLAAGRAVVVQQQKPNLEDKLTRNDDGALNTEAIDSKTSLRDKALKAGQ